MSHTGSSARGPLSTRGQLYRVVGGMMIALFLAGLITGGIGALYCNIPFMDLAQWFFYAEFALGAAAMVIRGGMTKPHPR